MVGFEALQVLGVQLLAVEEERALQSAWVGQRLHGSGPFSVADAEPGHGQALRAGEAEQ